MLVSQHPLALPHLQAGQDCMHSCTLLVLLLLWALQLLRCSATPLSDSAWAALCACLVALIVNSQSMVCGQRSRYVCLNLKTLLALFFFQVQQPYTCTQPYFGSSAPFPTGASPHMLSSTPVALSLSALLAPPFLQVGQSRMHSSTPFNSAQGSPVFGNCKILLILHFVQLEQSCVCVPQHFPSFIFSPGGSAPHEHTVVPHCLHTFSRKGSPTVNYLSILLASALSPGGTTPHVHSPVGIQSNTLLYPLNQSPGRGAPCVHTMVPSCSCWIQIQEGQLEPHYSTLHVGQRTWMEYLPTIHIQGKCKQWHSPVTPFLVYSLSSRSAPVVP